LVASAKVAPAYVGNKKPAIDTDEEGDAGYPVAFYSDKHTVFRVARQDARGGHGITQFGRALSELNIEILCANSSQAKGRVERVNRTLQDRLVKELRLAGISSIAAGNVFLPYFIERFNGRFAVAPARSADLHRRLNISASRLRDILCQRVLRHVSTQLIVSYDRKRIMLCRNEVTEGIVGHYVEIYHFVDGQRSGGRTVEGPVPALHSIRHGAAR
jgi:hypothetical protein